MEQLTVDTTHPNAKEIIKHFEECAVCGSKLHFNHRTDYMTLEVHEEAGCPQCGVQNKVNVFILQ
jgi:DNA-directed RNA polymerase subunit RPC12/RpoP